MKENNHLKKEKMIIINKILSKVHAILYLFHSKDEKVFKYHPWQTSWHYISGYVCGESGFANGYMVYSLLQFS